MERLLTFIFGTIIGSGINALDWRLGQNHVSWVFDRSQCPDCGHTLSWWELVPVLSFIYLGGECSQCSESISWRYPLVELAAGLLFVLITHTFGISVSGVFAALIWTPLLLVYVHDARTMLVPNWAVWAFNTLAFASIFVAIPMIGTASVSKLFIIPGWLQILAGPILAAPFVLIWLVSGGRAMGFADAKIALGIGWLVGLADGLSAVVFAFWAGAVVSLFILATQRVLIAWRSGDIAGMWKKQSQDFENQLTMKSAVPFGPFLVIGLALVYFAGFTLI